MASGMDDVFGGGKSAGDNAAFPERPNHPDFWRLSDIILKLDGRIEATPNNRKNGVWKQTVEAHVDVESLTYVAVQRALRALGITTRTEMAEHAPEMTRLATVYMDGFIAGTEYKP